MSKYVVLDTTRITARYQTLQAWFKCRRSIGSWEVFMLWNRGEYEEPVITLYHKYKGKTTEHMRSSTNGDTYSKELFKRYAREDEALSLAQAKLIVTEIKLEVVAAISRYEDYLKDRKFRVSYKQEDVEIAPSSRSSSTEFGSAGLPSWLKEIAKDVVGCYARTNTGEYMLDPDGERTFLYWARMDTSRTDLVTACQGICSECLECGACDVPCQRVNLAVIVPLIKERRQQIKENGSVNKSESKWYEATTGVRMFKEPGSGKLGQLRIEGL